MDVGSTLVFISLAIYCFYSFRKSKLNIYLIFGTLSWYGAIYPGKHNLYQFLQEPVKSIINAITIILIVRVLLPYLRDSIKEYKEYRENMKKVQL